MYFCFTSRQFEIVPLCSKTSHYTLSNVTCVFIFIYPLRVLYTGIRYCRIAWACATVAAVWLRYRMDYCAFFLKSVNHVWHTQPMCPLLYDVYNCVSQLCHRFPTQPTFQLSVIVSRSTIAAHPYFQRTARKQHYRLRIKSR